MLKYASKFTPLLITIFPVVCPAVIWKSSGNEVFGVPIPIIPLFTFFLLKIICVVAFVLALSVLLSNLNIQSPFAPAPDVKLKNPDVGASNPVMGLVIGVNPFFSTNAIVPLKSCKVCFVSVNGVAMLSGADNFIALEPFVEFSNNSIYPAEKIPLLTFNALSH